MFWLNVSCLRLGLVEAEPSTGSNNMWFIEEKLSGETEGWRTKQGFGHIRPQRDPTWSSSMQMVSCVGPTLRHSRSV